MSTPSITLAQVTATVAAILGLVAAFGLSLTKDQQDGIVQVITVAYPLFLAADAVIRHGRSGAVAAQHALATAQIQAAPVDGVDRAPAA